MERLVPHAIPLAEHRYNIYLKERAIRLSGRTDITETTRWATCQMDRPSTILGLTK